MRRQLTVLIAGVGGASLGTEVAKSLRLAGDYRIIGCDISSLAFGHYADLCERTRLVSADRYIDHVLEIASEEAVDVVIPGAEEPMRMIAAGLFDLKRVQPGADRRIILNLKCFVDRNPHVWGVSEFGVPILPPGELPMDVDLVFSGVNPLKARAIMSDIPEWRGRSVEIVFLDEDRQ